MMEWLIESTGRLRPSRLRDLKLAGPATEWLVRGYGRFKAHVEDLQPVVSVVGGVASVVIAILAYKIDQSVQENALRESRINRSVALARSIVNDDEFRKLQRSSHQIEWHLRMLREDDQKRDPVADQTEKAAELMRQDDAELRLLIMRLLQHASRAQHCLTRDDAGAVLCDEHSLLALAGEPILEVFFAVRPILFCDRFLRESQKDLVTLVQRHVDYNPESFGGMKVGFDTEAYCPLYKAELAVETARS